MKDSRALAIMLPLLVVASLAAAFFAIEANKRGQRIDQLESQLAALPAGQGGSNGITARRSIRVTRVASSVEKTVFCPQCEGEGEIIVEDAKREQSASYACPVCKARGTLRLKVPKGNELCPKCEGMGRIAAPPPVGKPGKYRARLCVKCNGKGWSRKKT